MFAVKAGDREVKRGVIGPTQQARRQPKQMKILRPLD